MTTYRRFLLSTNSTTTTRSGKLSPPSNSKSSAAEPPESVAAESDFVVILAALLCALICVVGLIAVARCAWLRRGPNNSNGNRSGRQPSANKGLKKKILQSLPKYIYDSASAAENGGAKSSDCAICLTEYVDGDEIRVLPQCSHGFHVLCIDAWLGSHSSCPSCRQILVVARCQKCGEFPAVSGVSAPATASTDSRIKAKQDCVIASTSSTFLP